MTGPVEVELHPAAIEEALAACEWYRARSEEAADAFRAEVDRALELIGEAPERWPAYLGGTRRFLLHRFPFSVVYAVRTESVLVVAVAHARRRPGYWQSR